MALTYSAITCSLLLAGALGLSSCSSNSSTSTHGSDGDGSTGGSGGSLADGDAGGSGGATSATAGEGGALAIPSEEFLATSVAVGFNMACAITPSAEVACWGQRTLGSMEGQEYFPVLVPGLEGIVALRSAWDTVCALNEAGTLACWGGGAYGQLGNGRSGDGYREDRPVAVVDLDEVVDFAHSGAGCAVRKDGSVWCWGANEHGQLGFDSEACGPYAIQLDTVTYLESDCEERPRQVPGIDSAVQVSVGTQHECALLADESVVCWGADDTSGELGRGQTDSESPEVPAAVTGLGGVRKVAAGHNFTCALSTAGEVSCWGSNFYGTLGRGLTDNALQDDATPAPVDDLGTVVDLAVHYTTACAVTEAGKVYCWGETSTLFDSADRPDASSSIQVAPAFVPYVRDAVQVSTYGYVACARQPSNQLVCWGRSRDGATGNGQIEAGLDYSGLPVVWDP